MVGWPVGIYVNSTTGWTRLINKKIIIVFSLTSFYFVCGFTLHGLLATGPHHHLQWSLDKPPSNSRKKGHELTMWDIVVWVSPQEYSLLEAISFYRRHSGPALQSGNDSAETTGVKESHSQVVRLWSQPLNESSPMQPTPNSPSQKFLCQLAVGRQM